MTGQASGTTLTQSTSPPAGTPAIVDVFVDEEGRHMVQVEVKMQNQLGAVLATAKAEIELPKRPE